MKAGKSSKFYAGLCAALLASALNASPAFAQGATDSWFGLPLPGPATDAQIVRDARELPPIPSPFAGTVPEFDGAEAHRRIVDIVNFSYEARDAGDPFWGRMTGSPSYNKTIDYIEATLKSWRVPGLSRHVVPFYGPERLPTAFQANVVMLDKSGNEVERLALQSAFPLRYVMTAGADGKPVLGAQRVAARAPLVSIGRGNLVDIATRDLRGKIAVASIPAEPTPFYSEYRQIADRAAAAGAVGLVLAWSTPGNMQIALANCKDIPCVNLGGKDGAFLRALMARAEASPARELVMELGVDTEARDNKTTTILVTKVPGQSAANNIVVFAHADAYLSGANDNASGVAILMSLIKYYSKQKNKYDIYFVVSPGHHSNTQGSKPFVDLNPQVPAGNLLTINIEHVAQRGIARSQFGFLDNKLPGNYDEDPQTYVFMNADSTLREVQLSHANNEKVAKIFRDAITSNRLISPARIVQSTFQEVGPIAQGGGITMQHVETSLLYHTSGDTPDTVSPVTLEGNALFYKTLIDNFSKTSKEELLN